MAVTRSRAPISIYVIWHPACPAAPAMAREIFEWFRTATGEVMPQKVGLPVHYRSLLSSKGGFDKPIEWNGADTNWVVLLVDEHMLIDAAWRAAIDGLLTDAAGRSESIKLFPVALHSSAGRIDPRLAEQQFIVPGVSTQVAEDKRAEQRCILLRRMLTQAFAREAMRMTRGERAGAEPLRVFISHAKADGREIADRCRLAIYSYGQIEAFFDEHEIAWTGPWRTALEQGVSTQSVALLAVETDAYASRPWCRRELALARRPHRLSKRGLDARIWRVLPTVVATSSAGRWSKVMSELGNVPRIGWDESRMEHILDKLLLEALLARSLAARHRDAHIVTWVPDVHSLLAIRNELQKAKGGQLTRLIYPGHGLTSYERDQVERGMSGVMLHTFEEALA